MKIMIALTRFMFIFTILVLPPASAAQGRPSVEPWFSVTISTPEPIVTAGADVKLKIIFANNTGKDLHYAVGGPARGGPAFDIDIRDGEGKPVPETTYGLKMHGKDPRPFSGSVFSTTVHPGETIEQELILSKEYDLNKAGKYTVQVKEKNSVFQNVQSNTITITLVP